MALNSGPNRTPKASTQSRAFARRIVDACARVEGFDVTEEQARIRKMRWPTAAQRHNNPGNLMDYQHYKLTRTFRLQQYATVEAGFRAAEDWWMRRIREGKTLRQALHIYAPKGHGDNDPEHYTALVAAATGIAADRRLAEVIPDA
jgi:hypothetical protein